MNCENVIIPWFSARSPIYILYSKLSSQLHFRLKCTGSSNSNRSWEISFRYCTSQKYGVTKSIRKLGVTDIRVCIRVFLRSCENSTISFFFRFFPFYRAVSWQIAWLSSYQLFAWKEANLLHRKRDPLGARISTPKSNTIAILTLNKMWLLQYYSILYDARSSILEMTDWQTFKIMSEDVKSELGIANIFLL